MNALGSNQQFDPHYAEAVLQSYVRGQLMMGRTNEEVGKDLEDLQARVSSLLRFLSFLGWVGARTLSRLSYDTPADRAARKPCCA